MCRALYLLFRTVGRFLNPTAGSRKDRSLEMINTLALAVALAMDAFAVSIASGVALRTVSARQTFRLAWHFGLFRP
jgi:hypothetical protein